MIPKGLFTQIAMVVLSIAIIFTYVEPAFSAIGEVQDNIGVYRSEREKVASVNSQLAGLVQQLESVSREDQRRLVRYMPDEVDPIAVPRDLAILAVQAGVLYKSASFSNVDSFNADPKLDTDDSFPEVHSFSYTVEGTYGQIKNLFRLMELNDYPLEIRSLSIQKIEGDFLTVSMQIATFAYDPTLTTSNAIVN